MCKCKKPSLHVQQRLAKMQMETNMKNSISPQTSRSIDDNYPSGSVIDHKTTNKIPGFAGKEKHSVIKMNNCNAFLKDHLKVVDLNVCIDNQNDVSSNKKMKLPKISFMTAIFSQKIPLQLLEIRNPQTKLKIILWSRRISVKKGS